MLKETLKQLLDDPGNRSKDCKLGKIISSQDPETAQLLIETLKSSASTMGIVRALKAEGIFLSREYLGEKRARCFKENNPLCCLAKIDTTGKSK